MKKILLSLLLSAPFIGFGQVSITAFNTPSNQNFDGMGATGIAHVTNWSAVRASGSGTAGASLDPVVTTGTSNSGAVYNVGSASTSDRALGTLSSGTTIPRFGAGFTNNINSTVSSISFAGVMEQWRTGSDPTVETVAFEYSTNASGINDAAATWVALTGMNLVEKLTADNTNSAVDGNLPANKTVISGAVNITLANTATIYVRWTDANDTGSDGMYSLDDFSISFSASTLPIQLTSFNGKAINQSILLNWNTASETNNDYYDVLRSADGKSFTSIGTVKGAGTSTTSKDYSFSDENPYASTNYYQLIQHDFDGKTAGSAIIPVDSKIDATKLSVYASVSSVKISLSSPNKTKGFLQVFDIAGRKLSESSVEVNKGFNSFELPLTLINGVHFARFSSGSETINQKFIK